MGSHTISVQESDQVQAKVAGPSLFSSLSDHAANMEDHCSDVHTVPTVPTDFPKVSLVPLFQLMNVDCLPNPNFTPA